MWRSSARAVRAQRSAWLSRRSESVGSASSTHSDLGSDNFNRYVFACDTEIGTPKVTVLRRSLRRRTHLQFEGFSVSCDSHTARQVMADASLVVSTSNTVSSRRVAAAAAWRHKAPHVFVGVEDGRIGFGGAVVWIPERTDLACQACYLAPSDRESSFIPDASLVTTAIAVVSGLAAHLILRILTTENRERLVDDSNTITVSLDSWQLDRSLIRRRDRCSVCDRSD